MSVTEHPVKQGSDEWQELRRDRYTGSNAGKLLRFGTITYARTESSLFKGNFYTKRGHLLEDEAIELYERIYKRKVSRPGFVTNSDFERCGYSPDAIDADILLEVKCFNQAKHRSIAKGEIPFEVLAQIHFGLLICGLRKARLIIYNPELDAKLALRIIDIKYSRNIHTNFKGILRKEVGSALHPQTADTR